VDARILDLDMRNQLKTLACAAVLVLATMAPSAAHAADPKVQQDLEQSEQALVNLDYDNANKVAQRLVATRGLTHEQLVRAYRVLALTDAVLDKEQQAREAFQLLLTYDPSYAGDPNLGPKVQAPFMEARGFWRAQAVQPGAEASVSVHATEPGTIRLTVRDPMHVGKKAVIGYRWGGDGPFQITPVPAGEGSSAEVPPPPAGTSRLDYYALVLDDRDSVVFEVGNANAPKTTTVDLSQAGAPLGGAPAEEGHSVFASPWFWVVTVAVIGGGVTAVALATHKTNPPTTVTETTTLPPQGNVLGPSLICGSQPCK
jgi:hypothetical protein